MISKILIGLDTGSISIGSQSLVEKLNKLAKNNNAQVVETGGYGLYNLEPFVEVEVDDNLYGFSQVEEGDVDSLIINGKINDKHKKYIGLTKDLPTVKCQNRFTFKRAGRINPTDFTQYKNNGGTVGLNKALTMKPQEIIDEIKNSGLRGRGGAGFPTGIKWQTVLDNQASQKYIVCNADEGDSGTFADRLIIESDPFTLIEGMVIAGIAVEATKGYVYLRSEYPLAYTRLQKAIEVAYENNLLGRSILGSGINFDLKIHKGAGAYICGEETSLLESLEGKRGTIRFKPPLPAIQGFHNQPTALNNVITLATVTEILSQGADVYNKIGKDRSKGTLTIQLAGNIVNGGLYEIPFGISLREVVYDIGGGTITKRPIRAVQVGGPLGAYFPESLFDLPLDYETFAQNDGLIGHGGIVVFDDTVDLAEQAKFSFDFCTHESCGKCTPCRIGSTRGSELISQIQKGDNSDEKFALVDDLCDLMEQTSLCALGGLTPFPVKSAIKYFPEDFSKTVNQ